MSAHQTVWRQERSRMNHVASAGVCTYSRDETPLQTTCCQPQRDVVVMLTPWAI